MEGTSRYCKEHTFLFAAPHLRRDVSAAVSEDQEERGNGQGELPRSGKRGWSGPCAVFALAAETERSVRLLTPPPCKHADSFALLLVLSKPKHRFGFARRNGGADVELSGLPGKRNGASPFGRYPLPRSSLPSRKSSLRLGGRGIVTHRSQTYNPASQRANRLRRQNERATLHFRINAKIPCPL